MTEYDMQAISIAEDFIDYIKNKKATRLLSAEEVAERLGVKRHSVYKLSRTNPDFPEPVLIGEGFSTKWKSSEIDDWVNNLKPAKQA